MNTVNIDMGWLGKVVLDEFETPYEVALCSFKVTHDGYTESGIRVHAVIDEDKQAVYPCVWQNAILITI